MSPAADPALRAVLFDVDGTLVDSTYPRTVAWWRAFRRAGLDVAMWRIHRGIGMGADQLVPHVLDVDVEADVDVAGLAESHAVIYSTSWSALRPLPGARELVQRCHDEGPVTVPGSSAGGAEVQVLRRVLDVADAIDHATSSDDAQDSRPAPDLVGVAVQCAGVDPGEAVFVGDAVWDVAACRKAGVRGIGLTSGGTSAAELRDAGAVAVFGDAGELVTHWNDSPLAAATRIGRHAG